MNFIKRRYSKMKDDARKFASSKNVPESALSFWMVFPFVGYASAFLSIISLLLISQLEIPDGMPVQIGLNMIIPAWFVFLFFGLGKYFFYAKILEVHYLNKLMTKGINKLDMYWWRKYRKQSPVTEALNKVQQKSGTVKRRLTKPQKGLIMTVVIGLLVWFYLVDDIVYVYDSIQDMLIQQEIIENDLGKISDGLR